MAPARLVCDDCTKQFSPVVLEWKSCVCRVDKLCLCSTYEWLQCVCMDEVSVADLVCT